MSIHSEAIIPSVTIMKILLVGESNVGKTSLITRYQHDKFEASSNLMTVGIDIRKLSKKIDGRDIVLELWDTAGQEKYKTLPMQYFRGVQGILLVYDITDGESFVRLQDWMDLAGQGADSGGVCMLLVGNKLDKENKREVLESEARNFALQKKMEFTETSAKDGTNVEEIFMRAMTKIIDMGIKCQTKNIRLEDRKDKASGKGTDRKSEGSCCS